MENTVQSRSRLTQQDWIDAAFDSLMESGIGAVVVDRLADRLGITRGSFYHHFADRDELLQAILDHWARRWTFAIRDQVAALELDPATSLLVLVRSIRNNGAAEYDAAIRAWALHDPGARKVVVRVDEARLNYIREQFERLGFSGLDAENRARLYLHYEMAAPAMFCRPSAEDEERLVEERLQLLTSIPAKKS